MAQATTKDLTTLPVGRLGLIPLISCKDLGEKVNEWLIQWRKERSHEELDSFAFEGYQRESYLIPGLWIIHQPNLQIQKLSLNISRECLRRESIWLRHSLRQCFYLLPIQMRS